MWDEVGKKNKKGMPLGHEVGNERGEREEMRKK